MAKSKKSKAEESAKPPASMWVKYNQAVGMPAGPARFGPFPNHRGKGQKILLNEGVWTEVNGTWAVHLRESANGDYCEFSESKPKDA